MTETPVLAHVVEPGWSDSATISNLAGPPYRLLHYSDGAVRFEHRCDRGGRGVIVCAPQLTAVNQPGGHQVQWSDQPTVSPSIWCTDCGTHGFVSGGRWILCG